MHVHSQVEKKIIHLFIHVKAVICGLERLNVTYEIIVRKLKFYKRLYFKSFYMMCSGQPCYLTGVMIV